MKLTQTTNINRWDTSAAQDYGPRWRTETGVSSQGEAMDPEERSLEKLSKEDPPQQVPSRLMTPCTIGRKILGREV